MYTHFAITTCLGVRRIGIIHQIVIFIAVLVADHVGILQIYRRSAREVVIIIRAAHVHMLHVPLRRILILIIPFILAKKQRNYTHTLLTIIVVAPCIIISSISSIIKVIAPWILAASIIMIMIRAKSLRLKPNHLAP